MIPFALLFIAATGTSTAANASRVDLDRLRVDAERQLTALFGVTCYPLHLALRVDSAEKTGGQRGVASPDAKAWAGDLVSARDRRSDSTLPSEDAPHTGDTLFPSNPSRRALEPEGSEPSIDLAQPVAHDFWWASRASAFSA